jgi:hypothetical protein
MKLWEAWKIVKPRDLWPLVHDIRVKGTEALEAKVDALYEAAIPDVLTTTEEYKKALDTEHYKPKLADKLARLHVVDTIYTEGYKQSSVNPERSIFDFNCSVGFRQHKGNIYVIRYEGMGSQRTLNFLNGDPRLVDFHYQTMSDKPEGMDPKAWKRRAQVWDAIEAENRWRDVLVIEVCSWDLWSPRIRPRLRLMEKFYKAARK